MTLLMGQKMITTSIGRDIRVIVIGKKVFACMERVSKTDFRSNIELGGEGKPFDLPISFVDVAEKVATLLDLDYCGIDILIGENNEPIVCEVNSNAFFGGIESVTNKNVAKAYAEYILNRSGIFRKTSPNNPPYRDRNISTKFQLQRAGSASPERHLPKTV